MAHITVSDWKSAKEAGGREGQELIFNFVGFLPYCILYYEAKDPGSK